MTARNSSRVGPRYPQVVVLVGATGDLSRRKLLPGLFHLVSAGFIPNCRIIGVSLDDLDPDGFRAITRKALDQFFSRKSGEADWAAFAAALDYVPLSAGAGALKEAVERAERSLERREPPRALPERAAQPRPCRRCGCWRRPTSSAGAGSSWRSLSAPTWRAPWR